MQLAVLIVGSVILSFIDYFWIKIKNVVGKDKKINLKGIKPNSLKQVAVYIAIPVSVIAVALTLKLFYENGTIYSAKRVCVAALLWPIAINDYKEMKIPNKLIIYGLSLRILIIIPELFLHKSGAFYTIFGEAIAVVGAALICIVCIFVSKGSLGMGDMKLMMVISSFLGIDGMINSLFASLFLSFIISIDLLLTKKKQRTDAIPFAPFILFGTIVSMILTGC